MRLGVGGGGERLAYDQGPGEGAFGLECAGHGRWLLVEGAITRSGSSWLPIWKFCVGRALFTCRYNVAYEGLSRSSDRKVRDTKCVI